ncbi:MAG: DUF885 domain-containing protein [Gemmatimonadetes bacterium]|nr:DUF885 domain-containing protein [Gemmatimonadota bacterium]
MSEFGGLLEEFFAAWWRENPTHATAVGLHAHDGELERYDPASLAERVRLYREYLRLFQRVEPRNASEELDRELVVNQLRYQLEELDSLRTFARNPVLYLEAPLGSLYLMAVRDYAPAHERARRATERLFELGRVLEEARANLTEAAPILVQTAAEMARHGRDLLERLLPLSLGAALREEGAAFARWDSARTAAATALTSFADWLETELLPCAAGDFAIGRAGFEKKLRFAHGLEDSADALLAYGEALKRETEEALARVAREIDSRQHWRALTESLKDEHPRPQDLISAYASEVERARAFLLSRELVSIPGGESLEVTATPEHLRPLIPTAAYLMPAPHDPPQTGLFFVTPPPREVEGRVLREHSVYAIPVTALHEAYPGHHLQFIRAMDAETEPRRVFTTSVFAEGWALYCEEMMWEQGFYSDPRQRLLQLNGLLWRACRVVVDVGLHARGWLPEQGIEYLVREAGLERHSATIEVRRYCGEPTQPLSYAVGKREILRLREQARAQQGNAFRLRDFHDRLLGWGTIPPALIARGMGLG